MLTNENDIEAWLKKMDIRNYDIHNGVVDVAGDVALKQDVANIPVQFRYVSGSFFGTTRKLVSLKGCPHTVGDCFSCSYNKLTSLEGGPLNVEEWYACVDNSLVNLVGMANEIGYRIYLDSDLTSFEGLAPKHFDQVICPSERFIDFKKEFKINNSYPMPSFGITEDYKW